MSELVNGPYQQIAQQIMNEQNTAANGEGQMSNEELSLFMRAAQMLNEQEPFVSGDGQPGTDGEIAATVLEALKMTGGDVSQFGSALGADDYGQDGENIQQQISAAQSQDEIAELINGYMTYASPGQEAILEVLTQIMTDEVPAPAD